MKKYLPILFLLFYINSHAQRNAGGSAENIVSEIKLTNYPNCFSNHTTIKYDLPSDGVITLRVYNSSGQLMSSLDGGYRKTGIYRVDLDAANMPEGIYFCKLVIVSSKETVSVTRKLQVLK